VTQPPPEPDFIVSGRNLLANLEATLAQLHEFTDHLRDEIDEHGEEERDA
jgi:hypothetical protein